MDSGRINRIWRFEFVDHYYLWCGVGDSFFLWSQMILKRKKKNSLGFREISQRFFISVEWRCCAVIWIVHFDQLAKWTKSKKHIQNSVKRDHPSWCTTTDLAKKNWHRKNDLTVGCRTHAVCIAHSWMSNTSVEHMSKSENKIMALNEQGRTMNRSCENTNFYNYPGPMIQPATRVKWHKIYDTVSFCLPKTVIIN